MQARRAVALLASLRTVPAAAGRVSTLCVAPRRSFPGVVRAPLSRGFSDAAGGAAEGEGGAVKAGPTDEEYVDINEALVGHVIGKQGAQIQRIQKDSGARVLLKGTDAARAKAKEMIAQVVATAVANMPLRVSMSVTREQGGVLIGKGGENIRQLEVDTKCR
ncbi:hypothetical protein T484DRAFT_1797665 [Baffinella frigidus]|nr:hypothetical protein T484DRAFT_1797665 [Cryptophyta sp. CCMP2293]